MTHSNPYTIKINYKKAKWLTYLRLLWGARLAWAQNLDKKLRHALIQKVEYKINKIK